MGERLEEKKKDIINIKIYNVKNVKKNMLFFAEI